MHKRPLLARGSAATRNRPRGTSDLGAARARALLLDARAQLEREFGELFESGIELPSGLKENVESAIDRIGACLKRVQRGDEQVLTELLALCGSGDSARERLIDSLLLDAAADPDFRGPGLLIHGGRPAPTANTRRLTDLRHQVDRCAMQESQGDLAACARVLRLAIALGRARLEQLEERYDKQPERLTFEVARRVRAKENPLRMIGEEMNEIVRAAAHCLTEGEDEPSARDR